MDQKVGGDGEKEFERAREALAKDNTVTALAHMEKALKFDDNPCWYSYLGYCLAKERGQFRKGVELCRISMEHEQGNPSHYLNLAKVHLVSGNKAEALRMLREGMAKGGNEDILKKFDELGIRRAPPIPFLRRSNPLNKFTGIFLSWLNRR